MNVKFVLKGILKFYFAYKKRKIDHRLTDKKIRETGKDCGKATDSLPEVVLALLRLGLLGL